MSATQPDKDAAVTLGRRAFLARAQHELRTPVNAIIGYSRMLLEAPPPDTREDLGSILDAGKKLLEMVNGFMHEDEEAAAAGLDTGDYRARLRHDLRGLVNVVRGYAEFLIEEAPLEVPEFRKDVGRILEAGDQFLTRLDRVIPRPGEVASAPAPGLDDTHSVLVEDAVETLAALERIEHPDAETGDLLVVDDDEKNRDILGRHLRRQGYSVSFAENGLRALQMLRERPFDLVLLDIIMPRLNGYQVLTEMKADPELAQIPVIMISAFDDIESVVRCIELGADEYLPKTFNPVLLRARLAASLEKKRLRDREHQHADELRIEREKSERLLSSILPEAIAARLKAGELTIAESFDDVSVLFSDIVGFTEFSARFSPARVVERLDEIFLTFDHLVEEHGLEKIKSIGDAYMLAGGVPIERADHAPAVARAALAMLDAMNRINRAHEEPFQLRIGIHSGPVVAGIIGRKRFSYDLWGDTVNVASRMESLGVPGGVQISEATAARLDDSFVLEPRGTIKVKGKGEMRTFLLHGTR